MIVCHYVAGNIQRAIGIGLHSYPAIIRGNTAAFSDIHGGLGGIGYHIDNSIHILAAVRGILCLQNLVGNGGAVGGIGSNGNASLICRSVVGFYLT